MSGAMPVWDGRGCLALYSSVTPNLSAISCSRTPGSRGMQTSARAWLVRKLHSAITQIWKLSF